MPKNWNEYIILLSVVIADVNVVSWTWNSLLLKISSAKILATKIIDKRIINDTLGLYSFLMILNISNASKERIIIVISKIMTGKGNLASGSYPNELTPTIK